MKRIIIALALLVAMTGCGVCKHQPTHTSDNVKDSTVVHVKDSIAIHYINVEVPVPVEVMREIVPAEDSSHLETSVAKSTAYIDSLGRLHHSLENKKTSLQATTPVEEHHHSETHLNDHQESHQETITVEVEREFTWWEKQRLRAFWPLLLSLLAALVWIFRKPILKFISLLYGKV